MPEGGLVEQVRRHFCFLCEQLDACDSFNQFQLNEPKNTFAAHGDKVSIVKFHPTAEVIL